MDLAFPLEVITINNHNYRRVIMTTSNIQLVLMSVKEEIPQEVHEDNDQFFKLEEGSCEITLNEWDVYDLEAGDCLTVPKGTKHRVVNTTRNSAVKLYVIYSPPHHPDGRLDVNNVDLK